MTKKSAPLNGDANLAQGCGEFRKTSKLFQLRNFKDLLDHQSQPHLVISKSKFYLVDAAGVTTDIQGLRCIAANGAT